MVSVTVWNEHIHEREDDAVAEVYPDGIHATIAEALCERGHDTRTATLADPDHGLTEAVLNGTDVLVWWGHAAHDAVEDRIVDRVVDRVHDGMGLLVLHSGHASKPFTRLLGTPCDLTYREGGERERLWVTDPGHPITDGLDEAIVIDETETYGEPFGVPDPDRLVFTSWFEGGEVFRSGCCYRRGQPATPVAVAPSMSNRSRPRAEYSRTRRSTPHRQRSRRTHPIRSLSWNSLTAADCSVA